MVEDGQKQRKKEKTTRLARLTHFYNDVRHLIFEAFP
jgi:hypothetical protein